MGVRFLSPQLSRKSAHLSGVLIGIFIELKGVIVQHGAVRDPHD